MKTLSINVYEFDELNEIAKARARDWWREGALDHDWWDCIYEDAKNVGLQITGFDLDRNRHATGKFILGAKEVAELILKEHGVTCETHKTAKQFSARLESSEEEVGEQFLKSLLEDYSLILQNEYEYQLSDEVVDETIRINDYTFTEHGKRMG